MNISNSNNKNNDKNLLENNSFKKSRKITLVEKEENNSKIKKNNFSQKKRSIKKKSLILSLSNYKNAEEEIKNALIEMRRTCLLEIRGQSYDIKNLGTNKDENQKKPNNLYNHFSSKHLHKSNKDKIFEQDIIKREKFSKTLIIKNNESIKDISLNNNEKKNKLKNNNNNDNENISNNENKPKFGSSKHLRKIYKKKNSRDKFRFLSRAFLVIDSNDENESDEDQEDSDYLINPETKVFFVYDILIVLSVFFSLLYFPYELAKNFCLCELYNNIVKVGIYFFIDILFITDLIINFFLEYYTKEEEILVKISFKIIYNYTFGWFFFDFLASLPVNIISCYYCKRNPIDICHTYQMENNIDLLLLLRCIKAIKIFKILTRTKNQFLTIIFEKISNNIILDNIFYILSKIFYVIFALHIISCIHIFIGKHTFPGWIYTNEFQNKPFLKLYMISIYYITTTLTTVGYGDISSNSILEIYFRIILLGVGIIGYSWIISSISNGINKENYASINFENECQILEEIRINHKKLPYSLYLNIINHLKCKHYYQKKYDKHLLFNSLPYTLKNNLIFSMYKTPINKFDYFRNVSNSNFLVEVLSCFSPSSALKDDILLKENDLIEEIFFVREGKLALEVSINIDNPEESIHKYFSGDFLNFAFDFNPDQSFSKLIKYSKTSTFMGANNLYSSYHTNLFNSTNKKEEKNSPNYLYLRIHDIHKNEDYGDIFMFYRKRSPFALRVKTRRVKLFIIKKVDFYKLYEQYKNVFRSIHKKKMHNFIIIKHILIKTIAKFCNIKGITIHEKFKDTIKTAINELNKEIIPLEILKNAKLESSMIDEIDEEINKTIKDFDNELSHLQSTLGKEKRKIFENIKKVKSSNIMKLKPFLLDDLNMSSEYESRYYSSLLKTRKKKNYKKKLKKIKSNKKSNDDIKDKLQDFYINFSDSEGSIKTVEVKEAENNKSSEPKTMNALPKSLINSLKMKIRPQDLDDKKENILEESNIFICINNNCNCGKNIININNSNIINNMNNSNKKSKNSSNVTFNNIFNVKNKEDNNSLISKNKDINYKFKDSNLTNVSLYNMKKNNNSTISNIFTNYKKDIETYKKPSNFHSHSLSFTSADSFEINSSYRNLNQVTEGKYIKDEKLQEKTLKYISKKISIQNNKKSEKNNKKSKSSTDNTQIKHKNNNEKNYHNNIKSNIKTDNKKIKGNKNKNIINNLNLSMNYNKSFSSQNFRSKSTKKELSNSSIIDNNKEDNNYIINYNDYRLNKYYDKHESQKDDLSTDNNIKIRKKQ